MRWQQREDQEGVGIRLWEALNTREVGSKRAMHPLFQNAGKRPWSEGSACRPFETEQDCAGPAGQDPVSPLPWPQLSPAEEEWGRGGHLQFRLGRWEDSSS